LLTAKDARKRDKTMGDGKGCEKTRDVRYLRDCESSDVKIDVLRRSGCCGMIFEELEEDEEVGRRCRGLMKESTIWTQPGPREIITTTHNKPPPFLPFTKTFLDSQ